MGLATLFSRAQVGLEAPLVTIEVHLSGGVPRFSMVGLPEAAVRESRDRVRGAIMESHFEFPQNRITVNLAPADLPKDGGRFDLAIALGILAASGQLPARDFDQCEFFGELGLNGELRPVRGMLPAAIAATSDRRALVVPASALAEATLARDGRVLPADDLLAVAAHLRGVTALPIAPTGLPAPAPAEAEDLADVIGQPLPKRALEVAAAGGHHLLMVGPPGTGKSMLAARLPGILPPMDEAEALETAAVNSVIGQPLEPAHWRRRPFRAPHHTASAAALVGGGSVPMPGEISRAHNGVLFLDELPEFHRPVLEVLREPIERGTITISRARRQADFPARFQLVAAMNPCPCGYRGDPARECRCSPAQVHAYRSRVSGPFLDRIDLTVEVARIPPRTLFGERPAEVASKVVAERVERARDSQLARAGRLNARLSGPDLERHAAPEAAGRRLLTAAADRMSLSMRACHRVLRVARTIADLDGAEDTAAAHVAEALGFRNAGQP